MIMTNKDFEEMILAAMNSDIQEVRNIAAEAGDNAGATTGADDKGNYTMAFAKAWIDTAAGMLCDWEYNTPAAKAFFKAYGIEG